MTLRSQQSTTRPQGAVRPRSRRARARGVASRERAYQSVSGSRRCGHPRPRAARRSPAPSASRVYPRRSGTSKSAATRCATSGSRTGGAAHSRTRTSPTTRRSPLDRPAKACRRKDDVHSSKNPLRGASHPSAVKSLSAGEARWDSGDDDPSGEESRVPLGHRPMALPSRWHHRASATPAVQRDHQSKTPRPCRGPESQPIAPATLCSQELST